MWKRIGDKAHIVDEKFKTLCGAVDYGIRKKHTTDCEECIRIYNFCHAL